MSERIAQYRKARGISQEVHRPRLCRGALCLLGDVFGLLPDVDWQEYMICSGTHEEPDVGFFALMDWLAKQEAYSPSEML